MSVLTDKEWDLVGDVADKVYSMYVRMFPEVEKDEDFDIKLWDAIADFAHIFMEDSGIKAMSDFIEYAEANPDMFEWKDILTTCMHDINHRADRFMSPRTGGYLKENNTND